jgi:hypothetical protein
MEDNILKTKWRLEKEAKELAVYNERQELIRKPGAMATAVDAYLADKYGFGAQSTVWFICKRVEKRLASEQNN